MDQTQTELLICPRKPTPPTAFPGSVDGNSTLWMLSPKAWAQTFLPALSPLQTLPALPSTCTHLWAPLPPPLALPGKPSLLPGLPASALHPAGLFSK